LTVGELMHRLAGIPPETQVRIIVSDDEFSSRLCAVDLVYTIKLRARGVPFQVCVPATDDQQIVAAAKKTQAVIDAAEGDATKGTSV
jgi:mRNA-degrading endonuclease toxin of MazEF toxin-antitoxin module